MALASAEQVLQQTSLFSRLPAHDLTRVVASARRVHFKAGDQIFAFSDPGTHMLALLSGRVSVSVPSDDGKEVTLATIGEGEILGEIALLDGKCRTAGALALQDTTALLIGRKIVREMLLSNPQFACTVVELLCARLRAADERMTDILFIDLPVRLAKTLIQHRATDTPIGSQSELAKQVGASREYVNRCLHKWRKQGVVDVNGRNIEIKSLDALARIACETRRPHQP